MSWLSMNPLIFQKVRQTPKTSASSSPSVCASYTGDVLAIRKRGNLFLFLPDLVIREICLFLNLGEIIDFEESLNRPLSPEIWKYISQSICKCEVKSSSVRSKTDLYKLLSCVRRTKYRLTEDELFVRRVAGCVDYLRNYEGKLLLTLGIAGHYEFSPPFHFFKTLDGKLPGNLISFHAVIGENKAGHGAPVEWMHLGLIVPDKVYSHKQFEWVLVYGKRFIERPQPGMPGRHECITEIISLPFHVPEAGFDISASVIKIPQMMKDKSLRKMVRLKAQKTAEECTGETHVFVGMDKIKEFKVRTGYSVSEVVNLLRVKITGEDPILHKVTVSVINDQVDKVAQQS